MDVEDDNTRIYYGAGCENCKNTGYRGRIAIHEILVMTHDLRAAIDRDAPVDELRRIGAANGTKTLRQSCADLVLDGITTVEELLKVAYSVDL